MGYEIERFVSEIDENCICLICKQVYEDPKQITSCGHIFCFNCIEKTVINGNKCPIDDRLIDSLKIEDAPKCILEYIAGLKIMCDFMDYGCKEGIPLNRLQLHRINCEYHPKRLAKCCNCGLESEKWEMQDHNCLQMLNYTIKLQKQQLEELKETHSKDISLLETQMQRMHWELEQFRQLFSSHFGSDAVKGLQKQIISFSCMNDTQTGTHETLFIQTINKTFKCEANPLTKISQIKYIASSLANLNSNEFSLFFNAVKLEDNNYMSYYDIRNGKLLHLLPNNIFIVFDCVNIEITLGLSVSTSDTIKAITAELLKKLRRMIPEQLFLFLKHCSCALFYNDIKLEETYILANYDVIEMKTLQYCTTI